MALQNWPVLAVAALTGVLSLALAPNAVALPCGTVGTPGACSIDVGGVINYSFTDFTFVSANSTGGGAVYGAEDIEIVLATGGGLTAQLTFSKPDGALSPVYFANAGQSSGFTFSYVVTVTPLEPGAIDFVSTTTSYLSSTLNNGVSTVQGIVANQVNCFVTPNVASKTCPITGEGPLDMGNIVSLAGNGGNTSILYFSNVFEAEFTPDEDAPSPVPEPASLALLLAAGLGWAAMRRRG